MKDIYIPELDKFLTREDAMEYFRRKRIDKEKENDYKYHELLEHKKILIEISSKLDVIINLLRGDVLSKEGNLKNTLSENLTK